MDYLYITSQVLVVLGYITSMIGFQQKGKDKFLILQVISVFIFTGSFLALGAMPAVAVNLVNNLRNGVFLYNCKKGKENSKKILWIFLILIAIANILTFKNSIDILPGLAVMLLTYNLWQDNLNKTRLLNLIVSVCWLVYSAYVGSYAVIVLETLMIINVIIALFRYSPKKKNQE